MKRIKLLFCSFLILFYFYPEPDAREIPPSMDTINQFGWDRVGFHAFHQLDLDNPSKSPLQDTSLATLVVITNYQTYIFRDGYDDPSEVLQKWENFQKEQTEYRIRQNFYKEFREKKNQAQKEKKNQSNLYHPVFLKYDPVYRSIYNEYQASLADEYRTQRFHGLESPNHKESIQKKEDLEKELKSRYEFLVSTLETESNAQESSGEENPNPKVESTGNRASQPLPPVRKPKQENQPPYFENHQDGTWDYFSFSQIPRNLDYEVFDRKEDTFVQSKYGRIADTILDRLLGGHVEKLKNAYFRRNELGSRVFWQNCSLLNRKGKRLILITQDEIRYNLEDCDGDGKAETWEVHNQSLPFRYAPNTANIISIVNCTQEKYCKYFQNLLVELQSGKGVSLNEVRRYGKDSIRGIQNEDEILRDWEELVKSIPEG